MARVSKKQQKKQQQQEEEQATVAAAAAAPPPPPPTEEEEHVVVVDDDDVESTAAAALYLGPKSSSKPAPGRGARERLGTSAPEDFAPLRALAPDWRQQLYALASCPEHAEDGSTTLAVKLTWDLLVATRDAQLFIEAGKNKYVRAEALEALRASAIISRRRADAAAAADKAEEEEDADAESDVAESDVESKAASDDDAESKAASDDAESEAASDAESEAASDAESEAASNAESEAASNAESEAASNAESEAASDAESEAESDHEEEEEEGGVVSAVTETVAAPPAAVAPAAAVPVEVVDLSNEADAEEEARDAAVYASVRPLLGDVKALDERFGATGVVAMSSTRLKLLFLHAVCASAAAAAAAGTFGEDEPPLVLQWLIRRARALPAGAAPWDENAPRLAARLGHVVALELLLDEGCPADPADLCAAAAARGGDAGRRALRLLHEDYEADWDERCVLAAIETRDADTLRWLANAGAPLGADACLAALVSGAADIADCVLGAAPAPLLRLRAADLCAAAAEQEDPRLLLGLHARLTAAATATDGAAACGWTARCAAAAARRRDAQLLAWAHEHGCPWDAAAPLAAARAARPDCLAYCLAHHCPAPPAVDLLAAVGAFAAAGEFPAADAERERRTADVAACVAMLKRDVPSERRREVKRRRLNNGSSSSSSSSSSGNNGHPPHHNNNNVDDAGAAACMRDWLMFPVRGAATTAAATAPRK